MAVIAHADLQRKLCETQLLLTSLSTYRVHLALNFISPCLWASFLWVPSSFSEHLAV